MNNGWEKKTLADVCQIRPAKRDAKKCLSNSDPVSFVPMQDLPVDHKYLSASKSKPLGKVYGGYTYFSDRDVLLAKITPCFQNGKLAIAKDLVNGVGFGSSEFVVFRPVDKLHPEFLYYFLSRQSFRNEGVARMSGAVGHQRVPKEFIEESTIPLPTLNEQKRIVAILDESFAAIAKARENAERNLANARELFDSYLNRVFDQKGEDWTETNFASICSIESSLVDPRLPEYIDLPHIGAGNMVSQSDELENVLTAREEGLISNKYDFDTSMVLYSKIRPYLMKVSRPNFDGICSADVYPLKPHTSVVDRDFLYYILLSKPFTDYAIAGSARAGMPKVNRKHLFSYELAIPRVPEQLRLTRALDEVATSARHLESIYDQKLVNLEELKQSILQKAFTGQLTSKSPELELVG